jgi:hypothetical protein
MIPSGFARTMVLRDVRFILVGFAPRQWRLNATAALTLPVPVILNRFLTALFVFILGICASFSFDVIQTAGRHALKA